MNHKSKIKNIGRKGNKKCFMFYDLCSVNAGFSLVETIVAIAIIVLAIVGPITSAQKGLVSGEYSKDQMRANYLAEEGLEYIHYVRDVNAINEDDWMKDLNNCIVDGNSLTGCSIDPHVSPPQDITACPDPDNTPSACKLYFNSTTGIYSHQSGGSFIPTTFRRWVKIYDGVNSFEKKVIVSVEWKTGSLPKKIITVTGFINDWKKQPSI